MAEPDQSSRSIQVLLDRLSKHPWFTILSWLVSILLAIGLFLVSSKHRLLLYAINPTTTTLVQGGGLSDLHVSYKGQELGSDLTAVQILIWNAGRESIRVEHILDPIKIITSNNVRIIEAQIRGIARPVGNFTIDTTHALEGIVYLQWRILEHDDGAEIQLLLAGPPSTRITLSGVIEGQEYIPHESRKDERGTIDPLIFTFAMGPIVLIALFVAILHLLPESRITKERRQLLSRRSAQVILVWFCSLIVMLVFYIIIHLAPHPSFASW
jgi:hypothetical protein